MAALRKGARMDGAAGHAVFISYSRTDQELVTLAVKLLRAGGAVVFQDVDSIGYGDDWKRALADAIAKCERVLLFWTVAAAASKWVKVELQTALKAGKRIVPILLDATPLPRKVERFNAMPELKDYLLIARAKLQQQGPREPDTRAPADLGIDTTFGAAEHLEPAPASPPRAAPPPRKGAPRFVIAAATGALVVGALGTVYLWVALRSTAPPIETAPAPPAPVATPVRPAPAPAPTTEHPPPSPGRPVGVPPGNAVRNGALLVVGLALLAWFARVVSRRRARSRSEPAPAAPAVAREVAEAAGFARDNADSEDVLTFIGDRFTSRLFADR